MTFLLNAVADTVGKVVQNTVMQTCTFHNDTDYPVIIVDHDGTRTLHPHRSQGNYLVSGFSVDLIMTLPDGEVKINFPASKFENRTHKMSDVFKDHIRANEMEVLKASSKWELRFNHPGGPEKKVTIKLVKKNSWKRMKEDEREFGASVGGMIKAIEVSASFKAHTKLTQVDGFESEITETSEQTFKEPCYFWQEIIVVKTNQAKPFDELVVPTPHTEVTYISNEPGKESFVYCK